MIEPVPGIAEFGPTKRSGKIYPSSLFAPKPTRLWSMLPPNEKLLPWPNSLALLEASAQAPIVVASVERRSTVPKGTVSHGLTPPSDAPGNPPAYDVNL